MNLSLDGKTQVVGLIGWPLEHTLSPTMHNAAFAHLGLNWIYIPLPVRPEMLPQALGGLRSLGFRGVNVTAPHKETAIRGIDELTPVAQALGAINTIVAQPQENGDVRLWGDNTDVEGFTRALQANSHIAACQKAVILGAGGAARAVAYALAKLGFQEIAILARNPRRAEALIQHTHTWPMQPRFNVLSFSTADLRQATETASLLVNATPLGTWPRVEESPWPEDLTFPSHLTVFDLVYNPLQTRLLAQARAAGAQTIGGLDMLLYQGAAAFQAWTGVEPPIEIMRQACLVRIHAIMPTSPDN